MRLLGGFYSRKLFGRERGIKNRPIKISKNTIPLIIIAIAVICFGLGGLALVIYNIKNGLVYLTSTDLVGLHSTISAIQIARASKQEDNDVELKKFIEDIQKYDPEYPEGFR